MKKPARHFSEIQQEKRGDNIYKYQNYIKLMVNEDTSPEKELDLDEGGEAGLKKKVEELEEEED